MGAAHQELFIGQQGSTIAMGRTYLHEAVASIFTSLDEDVLSRLLEAVPHSWGWAGLGEREGDGRLTLHNSLSIYIDVIRVSLYEISERPRLTPESSGARSACCSVASGARQSKHHAPTSGHAGHNAIPAG